MFILERDPINMAGITFSKNPDSAAWGARSKNVYRVYLGDKLVFPRPNKLTTSPLDLQYRVSIRWTRKEECPDQPPESTVITSGIDTYETTYPPYIWLQTDFEIWDDFNKRESRAQIKAESALGITAPFIARGSCGYSYISASHSISDVTRQPPPPFSVDGFPYHRRASEADTFIMTVNGGTRWYFFPWCYSQYLCGKEGGSHGSRNYDKRYTERGGDQASWSSIVGRDFTYLDKPYYKRARYISSKWTEDYALDINGWELLPNGGADNKWLLTPTRTIAAFVLSNPDNSYDVPFYKYCNAEVYFANKKDTYTFEVVENNVPSYSYDEWYAAVTEMN